MKGKNKPMKQKRKKTELHKKAKKVTIRKTGISKKLIDYCKKELIKKYNELTKITFTNNIVEIPEVGDNIDLACTNLDKEILHELTDTQRNLLDLITTALEKIDKKEYGICEKCKKLIPAKRLKVLPWAKYCITCQTNIETT